jgi:predicted RNA binding protein YcfA (HicA-like mRNA interferase family)
MLRQGWRLRRINGSHHILTKEGHQERMVIPVHGNQPLKPGLRKHQMKTAGFSEVD